MRVKSVSRMAQLFYLHLCEKTISATVGSCINARICY